MHIIEKDCLIDFFKMINKKFEYVVMRNADELPFDNFSNDVDILIDETKYPLFDNEMKKIFFEHGFERVERTSFHGIECYTFYNIKNERPYSLKIDLFFNIEGGGVRYYEFRDVIQYQVLNNNGIRVFDLKTESYLTALKTLVAGGKLKNKYLERYLANPINPSSDLIANCPSDTLNEYLKYIYFNRSNPQSINRKRIIFETFKQNFKNSAVNSIKRLIHHYRLELSRMFNKQYFIVLVGPDGSGKTSVINRLLDDSKIILRSIPDRIATFHHRPHLFRNISDLFKKELSEKEIDERTFNPHSGKVSSKFISFFKLLYYSIDYRLGYIIKIMPLQRENKFIIFDRYFFDFIVDQKRSALKISEKTALSIYEFIVPKPNKVFFIKVDPEEAHARKKELPVDVIDEINSNYDRLTEKFNYFQIIPNKEFEKSYHEFLKNFIMVITEKIKV
ncbi:MAG: hypothetical protein FP820_01310 [Sulfurimonas sp.]|nr:hypothetical protein [Sulfurimonas sp.]MBU3938883.1 hypothetical protein [bacterium]MBU4059843.1 hypothetical protein [bacterium]